MLEGLRGHSNVQRGRTMSPQWIQTLSAEIKQAHTLLSLFHLHPVNTWPFQGQPSTVLFYVSVLFFGDFTLEWSWVPCWRAVYCCSCRKNTTCRKESSCVRDELCSCMSCGATGHESNANESALRAVAPYLWRIRSKPPVKAETTDITDKLHNTTFFLH